MLYRTHHHSFLFPFNPFTSAISPHPQPSTGPIPSLPSSSSSYPQEMECVQGALKGSLKPEMAVKTTQQALLDDLLMANSQSGGVSGDDFFVDDLLDFSNGFAEQEEEEHDQDKDKASGSICVSVSPQTQERNSNSSTDTFSVKDDFGPVPAGEISVPADELASLEWLSHFVEDSFSEHPLAYHAGKLQVKSPEIKTEPEIPPQSNPSFTTPVQTKARSKRTRTGGRVWSLGSPYLTESSTSSSTSSSSTTTTSSLSTPWVAYPSLSQTAESFLEKPPAKKQKKKPATEGSSGGTQQPRRCTHCGVQKTPQWRAGPLGAKTLCNACGVRYKSGRLLPEYRPACSPTFSSQLHSNNHRKVLEMRRTKEADSDLAASVQSF